MLNTNAVRTLGIVENRYFFGYLRVQKVSTHPDNHATKAVHVAATWGRLALKHISDFLFIWILTYCHNCHLYLFVKALW